MSADTPDVIARATVLAEQFHRMAEDALAGDASLWVGSTAALEVATTLRALVAALEPIEPDYGAGLHEERRQRLAAQEPTTDHVTAHALLTAWRAEDATLPPEDATVPDAVSRAWFEKGWSAGFQEAQEPDRYPLSNRCEDAYLEAVKEAAPSPTQEP